MYVHVISLSHRLLSSKKKKNIYTLNGFLKSLEETGDYFRAERAAIGS